MTIRDPYATCMPYTTFLPPRPQKAPESGSPKAEPEPLPRRALAMNHRPDLQISSPEAPSSSPMQVQHLSYKNLKMVLTQQKFVTPRAWDPQHPGNHHAHHYDPPDLKEAMRRCARACTHKVIPQHLQDKLRLTLLSGHAGTKPRPPPGATPRWHPREAANCASTVTAPTARPSGKRRQ